MASHHARKHITIQPADRTTPGDETIEAKKPPVPTGEKSIPYFMAWPSWLFEKMLNPLQASISNTTSIVSWMDSWQVGKRVIVPKSRSHETDTVYHYVVDLPGAAREDITLHFQHNSLILRVEATDNYYPGTRPILRRTFTLPVHTDGAAITADLKHGILTITIPKTLTPVLSRPRTITIG